MSNIERRGVASSERAIEEGEDKKIRGVASVFNSESRDLGGFTEVIDRHAFWPDRTPLLHWFLRYRGGVKIGNLSVWPVFVKSFRFFKIFCGYRGINDINDSTNGPVSVKQ